MTNLDITTDRLCLKILNEDYADIVASFLKKNKEFFEPYEAAKRPIYYTHLYQKNIVDQEYKASINKLYLRYYCFLKDDPYSIIGTVSFGNITPYPFCTCNIGYKFDKDYTGYGYAKEALTAAIQVAFPYLNMHRINAYIMENNKPSIKLIEGLGFKYEGTCEKNICIQNKWESHRLYSLINPY